MSGLDEVGMPRCINCGYIPTFYTFGEGSIGNRPIGWLYESGHIEVDKDRLNKINGKYAEKAVGYIFCFSCENIIDVRKNSDFAERLIRHWNRTCDYVKFRCDINDIREV